VNNEPAVLPPPTGGPVTFLPPPVAPFLPSAPTLAPRPAAERPVAAPMQATNPFIQAGAPIPPPARKSTSSGLTKLVGLFVAACVVSGVVFGVMKVMKDDSTPTVDAPPQTVARPVLPDDGAVQVPSAALIEQIDPATGATRVTDGSASFVLAGSPFQQTTPGTGELGFGDGHTYAASGPGGGAAVTVLRNTNDVGDIAPSVTQMMVDATVISESGTVLTNDASVTPGGYVRSAVISTQNDNIVLHCVLNRYTMACALARSPTADMPPDLANVVGSLTVTAD
jgi:hypothetical protein